MTIAVGAEHQNLVAHFLDAIRADFRISEAIAQRGSAMISNRALVELAGSAAASE